MAELVILNVPREILVRQRRLAVHGDIEAKRWFQVDLWEGYTPPFACFLCDSEIHKVDATMSVPDRPPKKGEQQQMMISPICDACNALPAMVRGNRMLKIIKALHGDRRFNYKLKG
jgi:hypothetical protein